MGIWGSDQAGILGDFRGEALQVESLCAGGGDYILIVLSLWIPILQDLGSRREEAGAKQRGQPRRGCRVLGGCRVQKHSGTWGQLVHIQTSRA